LANDRFPAENDATMNILSARRTHDGRVAHVAEVQGETRVAVGVCGAAVQRAAIHDCNGARLDRQTAKVSRYVLS
jgi:hypothetical protein